MCALPLVTSVVSCQKSTVEGKSSLGRGSRNQIQWPLLLRDVLRQAGQVMMTLRSRCLYIIGCGHITKVTCMKRLTLEIKCQFGNAI